MFERIDDAENKNVTVDTYATVNLKFDIRLDQLKDVQELYKNIQEKINKLVYISIDSNTNTINFFKDDFNKLVKSK